MRVLRSLTMLAVLALLVSSESPMALGAAPAKQKNAPQPAPSLAVPLSLAGLQGRIHNCSRPTPKSTGVWEVSEAEVTRIDAALARFLRDKAPYRGFMFAEFVRQYVGLKRDEKRIVYINAFRFAYTVESGGDARRARLATRARGSYFNLCDGEAFGIEYDPKAKVFAAFARNVN